MGDKDFIEKENELEEQDYFQKEEQRRIKEELDTLLRESNPLINKEQQVTAEELEDFYSLTARRRKKKRYNLKRKILNIVILIAGVILIIGIMWITFNSIQAMFNNRENQLTEERKKEIELLNMQIKDLKQENEYLSSRNSELQIELEELKTQVKIKEQFSEALDEHSKSDEKIETSTKEQVSYYTVQEGDTLWKISTKLYGKGQYYKNIMDYNNISSENDLDKGMKLAIPKL